MEQTLWALPVVSNPKCASIFHGRPLHNGPQHHLRKLPATMLQSERHQRILPMRLQSTVRKDESIGENAWNSRVLNFKHAQYFGSPPHSCKDVFHLYLNPLYRLIR